MKFYYTLRSLLRERGTLAIKTLSLTFGLLMGLLLLARVNFELSFDRHYSEADHLMRIKAYYTIGGEREETPTNYLVSPLPEAIKENFPEEVESATVMTRRSSYGVYYNNDHRFADLRSIYADCFFFQTMGIDVLFGDTETLTHVDRIFISQTLARKIFGEENPVGQTLYKDKNYPLTIQGVFRDIPENSTLRHDVVISLPTLQKVVGYSVEGWNREDCFFGYVRLRGTDPAAVNARMDEMLQKYMPDRDEDEFKTELFLSPITQDYAGVKVVRMMVLIMTLLALVVLGIASLNYVLVSVSSLGQRAKAVGVHKCSGATNRGILGMFLMETGVVILVSLLLVILLIYNLSDFIEDVACASLGALFTLPTLGVLASVVLILFLLTGLLPGRSFARIPVTQVFRRYTERRTRWKRPLLFVQFMGVAFIYALLLVVLLQYNHLLNKPLGYDPEGVAVADVRSIPNPEFLKDELKRMSMVEEVGIAYLNLLSGWGATPIRGADDKALFITAWNSFDKDYLPLMRIELKEGKNFDADGQILVNEEFVRMMRKSESLLGKPLPEYRREGIVVGIMKDFPVEDWTEPIKPVLVQSRVTPYADGDGGHIAVRMRHLTAETLAELNAKVAELFPQAEVRFESLSKQLVDRYQSARRFRDVVVMTSVVILLITFAGLVGYVREEVRRRSKEIAIRKVNGAESGDILALISRDLWWTSLFAVVLGVAEAYFLGNFWLEQFHEKNAPGILSFILMGVGVLLAIFTIVVIKAWRVANENPVKSIKSE